MPDPIIRFKTNGTKVVVTVDPNMQDAKTLQMNFECGDNWYAELLCQRINERVGQMVETIRSEEYNRGWHDAKSKKIPKQTWFGTVFKKIHDKF